MRRINKDLPNNHPTVETHEQRVPANPTVLVANEVFIRGIHVTSESSINSGSEISNIDKSRNRGHQSYNYVVSQSNVRDPEIVYDEPRNGAAESYDYVSQSNVRDPEIVDDELRNEVFKGYDYATQSRVHEGYISQSDVHANNGLGTLGIQPDQMHRTSIDRESNSPEPSFFEADYGSTLGLQPDQMHRTSIDRNSNTPEPTLEESVMNHSHLPPVLTYLKVDSKPISFLDRIKNILFFVKRRRELKLYLKYLRDEINKDFEKVNLKIYEFYKRLGFDVQKSTTLQLNNEIDKLNIDEIGAKYKILLDLKDRSPTVATMRDILIEGKKEALKKMHQQATHVEQLKSDGKLNEDAYKVFNDHIEYLKGKIKQYGEISAEEIEEEFKSRFSEQYVILKLNKIKNKFSKQLNPEDIKTTLINVLKGALRQHTKNFSEAEKKEQEFKQKSIKANLAPDRTSKYFAGKITEMHKKVKDIEGLTPDELTAFLNQKVGSKLF